MGETKHAQNLLGIAIRGSLFVYILGAALAFASQILLARLMGVEEYGIYYYALSWLMVIALISQFGFDQTLLRFMPVYAQEGNWARARGILNTGGRLVTINGLTLGAVMVLATLALGDALSPAQRNTFILAALCLPLRGLVYMRQATLRSFMFTVRSLLPDAVVAPLVLMATAAILYNVFEYSSARVFMAATVFALSVSFVIGAYWQARLTPKELYDAEPSYEMRRWFSVAFSLVVINGAHILLNNADLLILGMFWSPADVGVYGVSSRVASTVTFLLLATYPVFAPIIAKLYTSNRKMELQEAFRHAMRPIAGLATLLSLIFLAWGPEVLGLFGPEFSRGHTALMILVMGQLVNALCGPVALLLAYAGHEPIAAKVLLAVAGVSACVHLLVIPMFGMTGAATVTALSVVFWNLTLYVLARRRVGVDPSGWLPVKSGDAH